MELLIVVVAVRLLGVLATRSGDDSRSRLCAQEAQAAAVGLT